MRLLKSALSVFAAGLCMSAQAANPVSALAENQVFLKGKYLAIGVNELGTFGTKAGVSVPSDFHYYQKSGQYRLGLFADMDGLDEGNPASTVDFFLPGTEFEGFMLNYKKEGVTTSILQGRAETSPSSGPKALKFKSIENLSTGSELKARWVGENEDIRVTITHYFGDLDQYYVSFVEVENLTSVEITDLRFARGLDPDQESSGMGGTSSTRNTVLSQAPSNQVSVEAKGTSTGVSIYLVSNQPNSRVHYNREFNEFDLYGSLWTDQPAVNSTITSDKAIYLIQDKGTLAANKKASFYHLTGLTSDLTSALSAFGDRDEDKDGVKNSEDSEPSDPCVPNASVKACVNKAPTASSRSVLVKPNESTSINDYLKSVTDADGDSLSLKGVINATNGSVSLSGSDITYTAKSGFTGVDPLTYIVTDGYADLTVTLNVVVNRSPTLSGTPVTTIAQGGNYAFTPSLTDGDISYGDTHTFGIINPPSWATFDDKTGKLSGTPGNANVGTTSNIVISVTDSLGSQGTLTAFDLQVTNVNDAPSISGTPATTIAEDSPYSFTPTASDIDTGDTLTFSIVNRPTWATFDPATGKLSGTPTNEHVGTTSNIVISVKDSSNSSTALAAFNLTVTNTNDAPTISGTPVVTAEEDSAYNFVPTATDVDVGDVLKFSITNSPSWAQFDTKTGRLSGTPRQANIGTTDNIVISVSDSGGKTVSLAPFSLTVRNVNDSPEVGTVASIVLDEGEEKTVRITASDEDSDVLTLSLVNGESWMSLDASNGRLILTPQEEHIGVYSNLRVKVSDGLSESTSNTFSVEVRDVKHTPTVDNAEFELREDTSVFLTLNATDKDSKDELQVVFTRVPTQGQLTFNGQPVSVNQRIALKEITGVEYTPQANYFGADSAAVEVSDGELNASAAISFTVTPIDDQPTSKGVLRLTPVSEDNVDGVLLTAEKLLAQIEDIEKDPANVVVDKYQGKYGELQFDGSVWTYQYYALMEPYLSDANFEDKVQPLRKDEKALEQLSIAVQSVVPGSAQVTQLVEFDIIGQNDKPEIVSPLIPDGRDSAYSSFGFDQQEIVQIEAKDIDKESSFTFALEAGEYADSFTIDESGHISIVKPITFDDVKAGITESYPITVLVSDGIETTSLPIELKLEYGGDADGDGTTNEDERLAGTDPFDKTSFPDADHDGVSDQLEIELGTDPNDPASFTDMDQDGVPDFQEGIAGTDPTSSTSFVDADNDGAPDYVEVQQGTDPNDPHSYLDTDGDGVPDTAELREGSDPLDGSSFADTDGDGIPNVIEIQQGSNPEDEDSAIDSDGDGVSDYEEFLANTDPFDPLSLDIDTDKDGVRDSVERNDGTDPNDPTSFKDSDGDGVSDVLELWTNTDPNDPLSYKDADEDGVPDFVEFVQQTDEANSNVYLDTDKDGVPDYIEAREGTDPSDVASFKDTDGDGLADYLELRLGFNPNDASDKDSDGDLVPDFIEIEQGTNPNDLASFLDSDGDGAPDFHETLTGNDAFDVTDYLDSDGDGTSDAEEKRDGTDPLNAFDFKDSDADQVSDREELLEGTDPLDGKDYLDSDGDLMPDAFERRYDLDPENAADAELDLDSDGLTNQYEYLNGLNPQLDSAPPTFVIRSPVWLNATERLTGFNEEWFEEDYAYDLNDGVIEIQRDALVLAPGKHSVELTAKDSAGNSASTIQDVYVRPMLSLLESGQLMTTSHHGVVKLSVKTNGESPVYPLSVGFEVFDAKDQSVLQTGSVSFAQGDAEQAILIDVAQLGLTDEFEGQLGVRLSQLAARNELSFANIGTANTVSIEVTSANLAPAISLSVLQNGAPAIWITRDGGMVQVAADVTDANQDEITLDWTVPSAIGSNTPSNTGFAFDPSALAEGLYEITLNATDNGTQPLSTSAVYRFSVLAAEPGSSEDSDGDGVPDVEEGLGDSDNDNIPDYLDNRYLAQNQMEVENANGEKRLAESAIGTILKAGKQALTQGSGSVFLEQFTATDSHYDFVTRVWDFEIHNVKQGEQTQLVLPLNVPLPKDAKYRKYNANLGWFDFVEDAHNVLRSAPTTLGVCPWIGHEDYVPGLVEGNECLEITLQDGGPNDDDKQANGVIVDPGVIATVKPQTGDGNGDKTPDTNNTKSGGSMFWLLVFMMAVVMLRRLGKKRVMQTIAVLGLVASPLVSAAELELVGSPSTFVTNEQNELAAHIGIRSDVLLSGAVMHYVLKDTLTQEQYLVGQEAIDLQVGVNDINHVLGFDEDIPAGAFEVRMVTQLAEDLESETILSNLLIGYVIYSPNISSDVRFLSANVNNYSFVLGERPDDSRELNTEAPLLEANFSVTSDYANVVNPLTTKFFFESATLGRYPLNLTNRTRQREATEQDDALAIDENGQVTELLNGSDWLFDVACPEEESCASVRTGEEMGASVELYATEALYDALKQNGTDVQGELVIELDPDAQLDELPEQRLNNTFRIPVIYLHDDVKPETSSRTNNAVDQARGTIVTFAQEGMNGSGGNKSKFRIEYGLDGRLRYRVGDLNIPYEGFFDAGGHLKVYMFGGKHDVLNADFYGAALEDPYNSYWENTVKVFGQVYWKQKKVVGDYYRDDIYVLWETRDSKGKERYRKYKKKEKKKNYYYWGIKFTLKGAIKGEAGITGNVYVARGNILGSTIGPYASIDASGGVSVNAWVAKAGVSVDLNLMRLDAPFSTTFRMLGGDYAELNASLDFIRRHLDGKVSVWAKWKKPKWLGFKWNKKSKTIMEWSGTRNTNNLWKGGKTWGEMKEYRMPKMAALKVKTKLVIKQPKSTYAYVSAKGRIAEANVFKLLWMKIVLSPEDYLTLSGCNGQFKKTLKKSFNERYKLPKGCKSVDIVGQVHGYQFNKRNAPVITIE
ncbi:tandem-95 repeat protein [Pseudoalteromonas xiamenensis]|uniref:putative Ig domain-containing protein n=1 Tax=Pseudoalteromonas xiamenensis TaxID=882626 RepID=UPI0027E3D6E4|nr:putative Ig domain-containing protein [Pseudoalteromonas xiamenensis]WMN58696.1 tandem-95 repeat protein [Pseudoalteromonas xiamenensis]